MLRIVERLAVYGVVAGSLWWRLGGRAGDTAAIIAALATGLLVALTILDIQWLIGSARERREAAAGAKALLEAERLRRRAYDLCACLRLGFEICEDCWAWHPERATRELDRLRAAVGQFVSVDLSASG